MSDSNPLAGFTGEVNPYAAPTTASVLPPIGLPGGIWRQGKLLVIRKDAELPDVCIKSNEAAGGNQLKRKLRWHHPAIVLLVLLNVLLYILVAALASKRATVFIGLSDRWQKIRRRRMFIGWGGFLLGAAMFIAGLVYHDPRNVGSIAPLALLLGLLSGIGFGIYGLIASRMIVAKKINAKCVYIKGAHPEFLNRFPEYYEQG